jgi:hypothetical protein
MQVELWQLIGALGVFASAIAWLVALQWKQKVQEAQHKAHEDLCARRYSQIEVTHAQLVKVSDERHNENREWLERLDEKMDRLLARPK